MLYNIGIFLFLLTAIPIVFMDYTKKEVNPFLIFFNYSMICCIMKQPILLLGIIPISLLARFDKPIDSVYVLLIVYLIIIGSASMACILALIIALFYVLFSEEKVSYLVPVEIIIFTILLGG